MLSLWEGRTRFKLADAGCGDGLMVRDASRHLAEWWVGWALDPLSSARALPFELPPGVHPTLQAIGSSFS